MRSEEKMAILFKFINSIELEYMEWHRQVLIELYPKYKEIFNKYRVTHWIENDFSPECYIHVPNEWRLPKEPVPFDEKEYKFAINFGKTLIKYTNNEHKILKDKLKEIMKIRIDQ